MTDAQTPTPLVAASMTQDEWWQVARILKPALTRREFDADWAEFQADKARRAAQ